LNGAQLSVADVVIFPFVERFELALRLFQEYDLSHFAGGSVAQWLVGACGCTWERIAVATLKSCRAHVHVHATICVTEHA
jgi:hypothetical protein